MLNAKGYHVNDSDLIVYTKWKYRPFHFLWQVRCVFKDISFNIHDNEPFDPQIPLCKVQRKSRNTDILDRDEESLGEASALNSTIMLEEEEIVTAEEIPPEVLEAMKSLAKEVTGHNQKC